MTTPAEKINAILAPLDAYYAATPLKFGIGLQNFQSIRQYTKIPIAPITLIYGQNSAGKSAIHDALIFIHAFLSGKSTSSHCQQYLNRWASRHRSNRPLLKGYVGHPDDVVISINAWGRYTDFDATDNSKGAGVLLMDLWEEREEPARFSLRFHFSKDSNELYRHDWYIREFHLTMGSDEFIHYVRNKTPEAKNEFAFSISKKHLLFNVIGQLFGQQLDEAAKEFEFCNGKTQIDENWLILEELCMDFDGLEWRDESPFLLVWDDFTESEIHEAEAFRYLIAGLLKLVSGCASRFTKIDTVPPLRPVPKKDESCFRISSSSSSRDTDQAWNKLAIEIRDEQIGYLGESLRPHLGSNSKNDNALLDYVNHILRHPLFLNTGYEVIGECRFLLSAQQINEIKSDPNDHISYRGLDAEVTLKLKYVPENFTVEIEDVGVGVSQIIPVLCAICDAWTTYIHQPELHLHPKQQSHLGDIFIERINDEYYDESRTEHSQDLNKYFRYFFIETHSEHILLRILRRIRETTRSDIRNKLFGFTADQLCVLYVDKDENGDSQVVQLRVAENGEFIDRWPHGFFTERDEDLFDE